MGEHESEIVQRAFELHTEISAALLLRQASDFDACESRNSDVRCWLRPGHRGPHMADFHRSQESGHVSASFWGIDVEEDV